MVMADRPDVRTASLPVTAITVVGLAESLVNGLARVPFRRPWQGPDSATEKPMQGEVIAVGPGARNEDGERITLDVKAGDIVLFGKWSGTEVKIDGDDLLIMKEADIMGVIDGAKKKK